MTLGDLKYWAFVSYSHQDRAWGNWLHRTLEAYQVPSRLVGRGSRDGRIPRRLFPIFRDRDELPSSANLGDVLNESLRQSRYQIVICSPRSAASKWVNEEVKYFKSLGREDRVLCLIVNGEPNVFESPGRNIEECFCPALRFKVTSQGEMTDQRAEPIAADARPHADGKADAKLKLIAGLIDVGFDELKQRERRRRLLRSLGLTTIAACLVATIYAGWFWQQRENEAALQEQARVVRNAKLYALARSESLAGNSARAAVLLHSVMGSELASAGLRFMLHRNIEVVESLQDSRDIGFIPRDVVVSADGTRVVAVNRREAMLLDGATLEPIARMQGPKLTAITSHIVRPQFSGDGRRFTLGWSVQSDTPGVLQIYDSATGRLVLSRENVFVGGRNPLPPLSPDGQHLVAIGPKRDVQVVDVATGKTLTTLTGEAALSIAGFRSASELVVADAMGNVALREIFSGRATRQFAGLRGAPVSAAISKDRRYVAVGSVNGALRVWDLHTATVASAGGHAGEVHMVQFSDDGESLLSCSHRDARLWSTRTGALMANVERPMPYDVWPTLDRDGSSLLLSGADGVSVIDLGTRRVRFTLDAHRAGATASVFGAGEASVLTGGVDRRLSRWRWPIAPQLRFKHEPTIELEGIDAVWNVRFDSAGDRFVSAGSDGRTRIFDTAMPRLLQAIDGHKASVMGAAFSLSGRFVVSAGYDQSLRLFDTTSNAPVWARNLGIGLFHATFSDDEQYLLVKDWHQRNGILGRESGEWVPGWEPRPGEARFLPERGMLLWAASGKVTASDASTLKPLWEHSFPADGSSPEDMWIERMATANRILTGTGAGAAAVLDLKTGRPVAQLTLGEKRSFTGGRLTSDGRYATIVSNEGSPVVWDIVTGNTRTLPVKGTRFRPPEVLVDSIVLFASTEGLVEAWDVASGEPLGVMAHHAGQIRNFDLSVRGAVVTGSTDNTAALWSATLEERDAATIGKLLACKTPWEIKSDELVARDPDVAGCAAAR